MVRTKGQKIIDIIMAGMSGGFFTMMYDVMSLLIVKDYITSLGLISVFAPFFVGIVGEVDI